MSVHDELGSIGLQIGARFLWDKMLANGCLKYLCKHVCEWLYERFES